jgi:GTP cyclohydrolase II
MTIDAFPSRNVSLAVERARASMDPLSKRVVVIEDGRAMALEVVRRGVGPLDTPYGLLYEYALEVSDPWKDYVAIVRANLGDNLQPIFSGRSEKLLRVDSGCVTGQVFHDLTCDCGDQLDRALAAIAEKGEGLVIHVPHQDGRGLGLGFKLATLTVQHELGVDTVEASALLDPGGVTRDQRTYAGVIAVLNFFELSVDASIRLLSNNPAKLRIFQENGFTEARLEPITVPPTERTRHHLLAKQRFFGHIGLVQDDDPRSPGSIPDDSAARVTA